MTVESTVTRTTFAGNGSTTAFATGFVFLDASDLVVTLVASDGTETVQTLTTHYTVSGGKDTVTEVAGTGTVTMLTAPAAGETLVIQRSVPYTQQTDLLPSGPFNAVQVENRFDRDVMMIQQLLDDLSRAVLKRSSEMGGAMLLGTVADRAGKLFGFDGNGDFQAYSATDQSSTTATPAVSGAQSDTLANLFAYEGVNVRWFGAVGDGVTDDTAAFKLAIALSQRVYVPTGTYLLSDSLDLPASTQLVGEGVGRWDLPSHGRTYTAGGTTLLFAGTPSTTRTVEGVTDMALGGGVFTNGDADGGAFSDAEYALLTFQNADASGSTPATAKALNVGLNIAADNVEVRQLRVVVNYTGIAGYNDLTTAAVGDDWDIGILVHNANHCRVIDCQVVGYWRMAALAQISSKLGAGASTAGATMNRYMRNWLQGYRGVAIRGNDVRRCTARTTTTIEIPWTTQSPVASSGTVYAGGVATTYTSTTQVGDKITLNGCSPDPTGNVAVGGEVQLGDNVGVASCHFQNCVMTDLQHHTRGRAEHSGFGVWSYPSAAIEVSGYQIRDVEFVDCHVFANDVLVHLHDCQHVSFLSSFFEPTGWATTPGSTVDGARAARFIAQAEPSDGNAKGTYPAGEADDLYFDGSSEFNAAADFSPVQRDSTITRYSVTDTFYPQAFRFSIAGPHTPSLGVPRGYNAAETLMTKGVGVNKFRIVDDAFATVLGVDGDNQRVGVNTLSPTFTLDIQDTGFTAIARILATTAGDPTLRLEEVNGNEWDISLDESSADQLYFEYNGAREVEAIPSAGGRFQIYRPLELPTFTIATLPSASRAGQMIFVSDESGGANICFSDGTNWRRVNDRAIAS